MGDCRCGHAYDRHHGVADSDFRGHVECLGTPPMGSDPCDCTKYRPPDPMRERLARAIHESGADTIVPVQHPHIASYDCGWLADAILAALGPDVFLVDVEEVPRRLHDERIAQRGTCGDPWSGEGWDDHIAWHEAEARRLLGGRE